MVAGITALRAERLPYWRIARLTGIPGSLVARAAKRLGCHKLPPLQPPVPIIRYERDAPGDMIHINTRKLGRIDGIGHRITSNRKGQSNKRGTGWEELHPAVDNHSRLAYSEVLPDEKRPSCIRFLLNLSTNYRDMTVRAALSRPSAKQPPALQAGKPAAQQPLHDSG